MTSPSSHESATTPSQIEESVDWRREAHELAIDNGAGWPAALIRRATESIGSGESTQQIEHVYPTHRQAALPHRRPRARDEGGDSGYDKYWNGGIQPTDEAIAQTAVPNGAGYLAARAMARAIANKDQAEVNRLLEAMSTPEEQVTPQHPVK